MKLCLPFALCTPAHVPCCCTCTARRTSQPRCRRLAVSIDTCLTTAALCNGGLLLQGAGDEAAKNCQRRWLRHHSVRRRRQATQHTVHVLDRRQTSSRCECYCSCLAWFALLRFSVRCTQAVPLVRCTWRPRDTGNRTMTGGQAVGVYGCGYVRTRTHSHTPLASSLAPRSTSSKTKVLCCMYVG